MSGSTIITDYVGRGTLASRPVSPPIGTTAGALYTTTDTGEVFSWSGTAWIELTISGGTGWAVPFSPPKVADFTTIGTVPPTLTDDTDVGLILNAGTPVTGDATRGAVKVLPSGDFTVTVKLASGITPNQFNCAGLILLETATNKVLIWGSEWGSSATANYRLGQITLPAGFVGNIYDSPKGGIDFTFFRFRLSGTTLFSEASIDGKFWITFNSATLTTYFTTAPNRVGLGFSYNQASGANCGMSVPYWHQTF